MAALNNHKYNKFCEQYLVHNRKGAPAAYAAGFSKKNSAHQARYLLERPEIIVRIEELAAEAAAKVKITRESHMRELAVLRDMAIEKSQIGPATRAEELRGQVKGFYVSRHEVSSSGKSSEIDHNAMARRFAKSFGITEEEALQRLNPNDMFGPSIK